MHTSVAEVYLIRYLKLFLLSFIISGCDNGNPLMNFPHKQEYSPVIIFHFRDLRPSPSPDLPWNICDMGEHISGAVLLPETLETNLFSETRLIQEAIDNGMLLALVNDSCFNQDLSRDHIQICIDSAGNAASMPEGLLLEKEKLSWGNPVDKQILLTRLFNVYKPDFILIRQKYLKISTVLQIARYWTTPEILSRYTVIMYSIPSTSDYRGWAVFAGQKINGVTPYGLTAGGMFSTIRLLAGFQWEEHIPEYIPALSILEIPGEALFSQ